ncbi:MAG: phosphate/phosphite/phosphonate ABC transporter substrate-binding protein [Methylomonas sp.]|jgi:phosphonate transport system substrate-binding protein
MTYLFTVSPDFAPDRLSGWYIFNTWLQKQTGNAIHLELYNSYHDLHDAIKQDSVDLIYANPYDAATLVREHGFLPLAKPSGLSDEVIIAVNANSPIDHIERLEDDIRIAMTEDPDVRLIGKILLEPADVDQNRIRTIPSDSYILAAKHLLKNEADVGIFLAKAYDNFSSVVKSQLKILVRSQISIIHHSLMIGPRFQIQRDAIQHALTEMGNCEKGQGVLEGLGFSAWELLDEETMEFMIDLMDTLHT